MVLVAFKFQECAGNIGIINFDEMGEGRQRGRARERDGLRMRLGVRGRMDASMSCEYNILYEINYIIVISNAKMTLSLKSVDVANQ